MEYERVSWSLQSLHFASLIHHHQSFCSNVLRLAGTQKIEVVKVILDFDMFSNERFVTINNLVLLYIRFISKDNVITMSFRLNLDLNKTTSNQENYVI